MPLVDHDAQPKCDKPKKDCEAEKNVNQAEPKEEGPKFHGWLRSKILIDAGCDLHRTENGRRQGKEEKHGPKQSIESVQVLHIYVLVVRSAKKEGRIQIQT